MTNTQDILNQRQKTHGEFTYVATTSRDLKLALRNFNACEGINAVKQEALDAICVKLARIVNGDLDCKDHWEDIIGYATLALQSIDKKTEF